MLVHLIISLFWIALIAIYDIFQTKRINKLERKIAKYERMLFAKISDKCKDKYKDKYNGLRVV